MEMGALQFEEMIDRLEKGSGQQVDPAKYWEWNGKESAILVLGQ